MNYILKDDGTIAKVKKMKKEDLEFAKYCLIDISTDVKGPVYTLVKNPTINFLDDAIKIDMDISYSPVDIPFTDATTLHSVFSIDSIEKYYNVYPLINQMCGFNFFRDNFEENDTRISIDTLLIHYDKKQFEIGEYDYTGNDLKRTFRILNMNTNVNKVLSNDKVMILYKNHWERIDVDNDLSEIEFDKIAIPIANAESIYLLTYKEFHLFQKIKSLSVEVNYYDESYNIDDYYQEDFIDLLYVSDFASFLETCLYFPQMIMLEYHVMDAKMNIRLVLETDEKEMTLVITDKEAKSNPRNLCIYKIIKKLLKM